MVAMGMVHNTRILRFILVLIVVILTIFIYASYSTNATLTPTHMRAAASPALPSSLVGSRPSELPLLVLHQHINRTGEFGLAEAKSQPVAASKQPNKSEPAAHKRPAAPHRLPTIDEDALADGGGAGANAGEQTPNNNVENSAAAGAAASEDLLEESFDGIMGNINNTETSATAAKQTNSAQQPQQQQLQQPSDAEILIPTSNLQKFIENADKILKNMTTSSSSPAAVAVAPQSEQRTDKNAPQPLNDQPEEIQINLLESGGLEDNAEPQSPASAAVMRVKSGNEEEPAKAAAAAPPPPPPRVPIAYAAAVAAGMPKGKSVDPSKGIPTENIYEGGHMDNEIDADRICPHQGAFTKLLILITSAQSHADARMSIRQTWGHYGTRRDVSMAFILGRSTNETQNKLLTQENYIYGDLIRGSFIDSYNNLTLKTISSLEWIDLHCSRAKHILKTDDDMFINVPKLLAFLDKHKDKRVIYGRLAKKWKPIRNKKSKYYVSPDQFSTNVFPAFTTGPAYVLTGDIVHELYVRSLKTVYLKLEDVFTTGIVAQNLGIKRVHVNEFLNRRISFNPCNIRNAISVHMIKSNEQFDLWKKLLDQTTKCK